MSKTDLFFFVILFVFVVSLRSFHQMSISTEKAKNNTFYDSENVKNQTSFHNKTEEEDEINEELEGSILDIEGLLIPPKKKKVLHKKSNKTKYLNKTNLKNKTKSNKTVNKIISNKTNKKNLTNNKTITKQKISVNGNKTTNITNKLKGNNNTIINKTNKNNKIKMVGKTSLSTEFIQPLETELDKEQDQFISLSTYISQSNEIAKLKVNYAIADQAGSKSDKLLKKPEATTPSKFF